MVTLLLKAFCTAVIYMTYLYVVNTSMRYQAGFMTCFVLISSIVWPVLASSLQILNCRNPPCTQKAGEWEARVKVRTALYSCTVEHCTNPGGAALPDHHVKGSSWSSAVHSLHLHVQKHCREGVLPNSRRQRRFTATPRPHLQNRSSKWHLRQPANQPQCAF